MLHTCLVLVSYLTYSSALNMEATCFSVTSVDFHWSIQHHIKGDKTLLSASNEQILKGSDDGV
jgi:hypothetical protein